MAVGSRELFTLAIAVQHFQQSPWIRQFPEKYAPISDDNIVRLIWGITGQPSRGWRLFAYCLKSSSSLLSQGVLGSMRLVSNG